jgi:outer membrane autotransporter protein
LPISYAHEVQRWSAWSSAYGGVNGTDGDPLVAGTHGTSSRTYGFAAGMDYLSTPDTSVGFAVSSGGSSWSVAEDLGSGESSSIQLGMKGITHFGALYASAAAAYGFHDVSTDRYAFGGDHLTAAFKAHSVGGRVEGGVATGKVRPYAAAQVQSVYTPTYNEDDQSGGVFALSYDEKVSTLLRAEVGSRFDHTVDLDDDIAVNFNARLAYIRNWISDTTMVAGFQSLPGASFTVNGSAPPENVGFLSLGTNFLFPGGVSLSLRFDGEFARGYGSYSGMTTLRFSW